MLYKYLMIEVCLYKFRNTETNASLELTIEIFHDKVRDKYIFSITDRIMACVESGSAPRFFWMTRHSVLIDSTRGIFGQDCDRDGSSKGTMRYSGITEIEDLYDAVFEWMSHPAAQALAARRQEAIREDEDE